MSKIKTTKAERIVEIAKAFCKIHKVEYSDAVLKAIYLDPTCKFYYPNTKLSYPERSAISAVVQRFKASV